MSLAGVSLWIVGSSLAAHLYWGGKVKEENKKRFTPLCHGDLFSRDHRPCPRGTVVLREGGYTFLCANLPFDHLLFALRSTQQVIQRWIYVRIWLRSFLQWAAKRVKERKVSFSLFFSFLLSLIYEN